MPSGSLLPDQSYRHGHAYPPLPRLDWEFFRVPDLLGHHVLFIILGINGGGCWTRHFKRFLMSKPEELKSLWMLMKCMGLYRWLCSDKKKTEQQKMELREQTGSYQRWGRDVMGWGWGVERVKAVKSYKLPFINKATENDPPSQLLVIAQTCSDLCTSLSFFLGCTDGQFSQNTTFPHCNHRERTCLRIKPVFRRELKQEIERQSSSDSICSLEPATPVFLVT